jgi:hypothetical protein
MTPPDDHRVADCLQGPRLQSIQYSMFYKNCKMFVVFIRVGDESAGISVARKEQAGRTVGPVVKTPAVSDNIPRRWPADRNRIGRVCEGWDLSQGAPVGEYVGGPLLRSDEWHPGGDDQQS